MNVVCAVPFYVVPRILSGEFAGGPEFARDREHRDGARAGSEQAAGCGPGTSSPLNGLFMSSPALVHGRSRMDVNENINTNENVLSASNP